VVMDD